MKSPLNLVERSLSNAEGVEPSTPHMPERRVRASTRRLYSGPLGGLFLLAFLTTLHFARDFVLPIIVAVLFYLVFVPAVRGMKKLHVPAPLGAFIIVFGLLAAFVSGIYNLAEPAGIWVMGDLA